jgi:hypothetical protein
MRLSPQRRQPSKRRDDAALGQLLTSYASLLPLRGVSELCAPKLQKRLLRLTEGVTVRICRLLDIAAVRAIESGRERIETDLLNEERYQNRSNSSGVNGGLSTKR